MNRITIIECPRDAMQGWPHFIPTDVKINYLNSLVDAGFDVIDFGSFVSPKAIPQMADTREVLRGIHLGKGSSSLLAIIANVRGAEEAALEDKISYLGFPFSISETFQQRNTNSSMDASLKTVEQIQSLCLRNGKKLVVYLSMAFGNPYGDPFDEEMVQQWCGKIAGLGVGIISLADTVGLASAESVKSITSVAIQGNPKVQIGVHLHAGRAGREEKLKAALDAGCRRFDSAIGGIGGCPMAGDMLVGNMDTQLMVEYFKRLGYETSVDTSKMNACGVLAGNIFV